MVAIAIEDRERMTQELLELGATLPCSRCGKTEFILIPEYFSVNLSDRHMPIIITICFNCRHLTQHAVKVEIVEEKPENENLT